MTNRPLLVSAQLACAGVRSATLAIPAMASGIAVSEGALCVRRWAPLASIASAVLRSDGAEPPDAHKASIAFASITQFVAAASTAALVLIRGRSVRLVRS